MQPKSRTRSPKTFMHCTSAADTLLATCTAPPVSVLAAHANGLRLRDHFCFYCGGDCSSPKYERWFHVSMLVSLLCLVSVSHQFCCLSGCTYCCRCNCCCCFEVGSLSSHADYRSFWHYLVLYDHENSGFCLMQRFVSILRFLPVIDATCRASCQPKQGRSFAWPKDVPARNAKAETNKRGPAGELYRL